MEEKGLVASNEWMMRRREDHADERGGGGKMTHGSRGKVDWNMTRQGSGPRWLNMERLRRAGLFKHR
jgi:hypothetical protein